MNETYSQKSDKTIHIKYAINNSSLHIYLTFPLIYFFFLFIGYINGLPLCLKNIALHLLVTRWYLHGLAFSAVPSRLVPIDMCPYPKVSQFSLLFWYKLKVVQYKIVGNYLIIVNSVVHNIALNDLYLTSPCQ